MIQATTDDNKWNYNNNKGNGSNSTGNNMLCLPVSKGKDMKSTASMNDSSDEERDEGNGEILHCTFAGCLKGLCTWTIDESFVIEPLCT
jgi:hypothetical protein